jgi:DNA repair protein RecO (recombination protein O)
MDEAVVYLQPAYILQHRPYRETSLLLEVFTRDFGLVSLLAKGVRKEKSKTAGVLLPFALLQISYLDKNELKLLTNAEFLEAHDLQRLGLYCGFYVNELLQRFLHKHDPNPALFVRYQQCLQALLTDDNIEQTLRYFELDLLEQAGYAIELDVDSRSGKPVQAERRYQFEANLGMVEQATGTIDGRTLLAISERSELDTVALTQAKQLLRTLLAQHLQGKPLKSRAVLAKVIQYL